MDQDLRQQVDAFFKSALAACGAHPELSALAAEVSRRQTQISKPMRVAFVGKTNAGKSTMMNAFLGEEVAPTGDGELTFNVSWFKYGAEPKLLVHTVDGRVESGDFKNLESLIKRCKSNPEFFDKIRFIEVHRPHPLLKHFDLIDTPGLHSWVKQDSKNTQRLLNDPDNRPHAVVFLFSGTLQRPDVEELENFHRNCGSVMSGLTAIGVLTKADSSPNWERAFENGEGVIDQIQRNHPHVGRYFYSMIPAVGVAGFGAQTLSSADFVTLRKLASLPQARQKKLLIDVGCFTSEEYAEEPEIPDVASRAELFQRLGLYGIRFSLRALANGLTLEQLPGAVLAGSNVLRLREVVISHFGGRAYLIKLRSALTALRELSFACSLDIQGPAASVAGRIAGQIDGLISDELRLQEFTLLEKFYQGQIRLPEEQIQQLLHVTGEKGHSCAARLGRGEDIPLGELRELASKQQALWRKESVRPAADFASKECARILSESYAAIYSRLTRAQEHREAASALLRYDV